MAKTINPYNIITAVNVTALYNLAEKKEYVHPLLLKDTCISLCEAIQLMGIQYIKVHHDGHYISAMELSEKTRAIACLVVRIMQRWSDFELERLEKRFKIENKMNILLGDIPFFTYSSLATGTNSLTIFDIIVALSEVTLTSDDAE